MHRAAAGTGGAALYAFLAATLVLAWHPVQRRVGRVLLLAVAVFGVLRLRWLTQELRPTPLETLERGIRIRNDKTRWLGVALVLFVVGFSLYCFAVAQLLVAPW